MLVFFRLTQICSGQANPYIPVGSNKTTYIILYNTRPESANIGGAEGAILYAEQPTSNDTVKIIKLQAARQNFITTNLLIVCADTIMEFTLRYDPDPAVTRYAFRYSGNVMSTAKSASQAATNPDTVSQNGVVVTVRALEQLRLAHRSFNRSVNSEGLFLFLDNVALDSTGHHLFKLRLRNNTAVAYAIDYVKFIVENEKKGIMQKAGKAVQDSYPPYLAAPGNSSTVQPGGQQELLFALQKLPLNKGEQLSIIIQEQAGNSQGRTLTLKIPAPALNNKSKVLYL